MAIRRAITTDCDFNLKDEIAVATSAATGARLHGHVGGVNHGCEELSNDVAARMLRIIVQ